MTRVEVPIERWLRRTWFAALLLGVGGSPAVAGDEFIEHSPLRKLIIEYISADASKGTEEVAAYANERLPQVGINYIFHIYDQPANRTLVLNAGPRRLLYRTPDLLDSGPCDQIWIVLPAIRSTDQWIDIVHGKEPVRIQRPTDLYGSTYTIYSSDQRTVLNRLDIPDHFSTPRAVLPDGHGVLVEFESPEDNEAMRSWWKNVQAAHREITDTHPHLRLQVASEGIQFIGDPAAYVDEATESISDFPNSTNRDALFRERFLRTGLVVEYYLPCS